MKVKEFLQNFTEKAIINIYQESIAEIDSCPDPVHRYTGEVRIALGSNCNYLDYELVSFDGNRILCKANEEQKRKIIDAYRERV